MARYTTQTLRDLREQNGILLRQAADHFEISDPSSIRKWEQNSSPPQQSRRQLFLSYLWDVLRLSQNPQKLADIWEDVLVMGWGWDELTVDEFEQYKRIGAEKLLYPALPGQTLDLNEEHHAVIHHYLLGKDEPAIAAELQIRPRQIRKWLHGSNKKVGSIPYRLNCHSIRSIERYYAIRYPEQHVKICTERARLRTPIEYAAPAQSGSPPIAVENIRQTIEEPANEIDLINEALTSVRPASSRSITHNLSLAHLWLVQYRKVIRMRLSILFVLVVLFVFAPIYLFGYRNERFNYFSNVYTLIPATIGVYGLWRIHVRKLWGEHRFYVGYAALCISLLCWTIGAVSWSWFNFRYNESVPYPWWPDVGYGSHQVLFPTVLWMTIVSLFQERHFVKRHVVYALVSFTIVAAWMLYLRGWQLSHQDDPWKFFLDTLYPVTDVVSLRAIWHLSNYRTTKAFRPAQVALRIMAIGMLLLFCADVWFSTATTLPTNHPNAYYVGSMADFLFACGFYGLGCGLLAIPMTVHRILPPSQPSKRLRFWGRKLRSLVEPQSDESDD